MLIKTTIAAAILATSVGAGTIAVHKFANLQQADDAMLARASPDAIASPDAPAKLATAIETDYGSIPLDSFMRAEILRAMNEIFEARLALALAKEIACATGSSEDRGASDVCLSPSTDTQPELRAPRAAHREHPRPSAYHHSFCSGGTEGITVTDVGS